MGQRHFSPGRCITLTNRTETTLPYYSYLWMRMAYLDKYIAQIKELCSSNRVSTLFAFGSVTTDRFNDESDIDLIVSIEDSDPISYSEKYFNLKFQLEKLLNRKIDLLEDGAIRNQLLKSEIDKSKVLVYGERN